MFWLLILAILTISVPFQSIRVVVMTGYFILSLAIILKFTVPVQYDGKIVIMFLVVGLRNDKCQWLTAIDLSEKQHSILFSTTVHAQY